MKLVRLANWNLYPWIITHKTSFNSEEKLKEKVIHDEHFIARGNGRSYGDASLGSTIYNTLNYNKILKFDTDQGVIIAESGTLLSEILNVIIPSGWFLPVTPGTKYVTIGGAVAADVHGKNHHKEGCISDHIIYLDILTDDGNVYKCSRVQHPDLFFATCGGMGLTGVILSVTLKLKKINSSFIKQTVIKARNIFEMLDLLEENSNFTHNVSWLDCITQGKSLGKGIINLGEHVTNENSELIPNKKPPKWNIPFYFPNITLNHFTNYLFNKAYYSKEFKRKKTSQVHYEPFFYPLDGITNWNRMYGKRGFVQYQFVIPMEAGHKGFETILKLIVKKGFGSFVSVLKILGTSNENPLSFPKTGYTLALDFAITKNLFEFLNELDKVVLDFNGRLYLAKDARMNRKVFEKSYPRYQEFIKTVKKYNPNGKLKSKLSERLLPEL